MAVVLVTGCSTGFGLLTALRFARAGDTVVATMRDPAAAGALEAARDAEGLDLHVGAMDVVDDASVTAAVGTALDVHGRLDVVVNNAGVGIRGAIEEVTAAQAQAVFETNVFGLLRVTRAVLPALRAQRSGVIVNVSSLSGLVSPPFAGIYAATKHAVEAISEALHYELGPFGVRVVVVEPGSFPTCFDDNRAVADPAGRSPYAELRRRWEDAYERVPGRDGRADPAAVADAVYDAATDPAGPRRRLVGADAELVGQLRRQLDDEAFEHTIRSALDFWDGAPGRA